MPTRKLTNKLVVNAKPSGGGRTTLWDSVIGDDTTLPGSFGLRITDRGVKSWIAMYRVEDAKNPGKKVQRFWTLGRYPALSLATAREMARDALKTAGRDIDPIEERKEAKRKKAREKTVGDAVAEFIKRYVTRENKSWREIERVFAVYILPEWKERSLRDITPSDVHEVLDRLIDANHPYMANRVLAHVRKFFNWCKGRHWIIEAPTDDIRPPGKEQSRDRILDKTEIEAFWRGCDALGWPFGPCFKLLLVTGQRRDEVARLKWEHLDLETGTWTLPRDQTKSDRRHDVPLSPMAMEIIEALPRNGDYVFSTTGKTPISGFSKSKIRLDMFSEISDWRLHDLRRTVASGMAEIGIAPHVIEKVLNHSSGQISGIAAVYNRHTYLREKLSALNAWANAIEAIVKPGKSNLVPLHPQSA
ncbi:MAG: tyrosine-type recombinase/integrase [Gammaproteobacteria bacterium]|nr:tyrosine-type recombinase/integrase [Gammaproteobacteria bacterium]